MHLISPSDERLDALHAAYDAARELVADRSGTVGYGFMELRDESTRRTKLIVPFSNLITDAGDLYLAGKAIAAIAPASPSAPTAASGMKLGTGSTAVAKNSTGSALTTYLTGSNAAFDATYPQTANLGAGLGVNAVYKVTWAAGTATSSTINEVAVVNDAATNATSTSANTYSRALLTTVNKTASDSLACTYNWKNLGA
jgi:hypothetical protein